jgi:SAM-dependent methyltransferase
VFPTEARLAAELVAALKLKKDKDIAILGSALCGGARILADKLQAKISCYEWDPAMAQLSTGLNSRSGAGFLLKTHQIAIADGFPAGRQYDNIFVFLRLHQRPDRGKLIKQLAAALKPGGTLCTVNYVSGAEPLAQQTREKLFSDAAPGPFMRLSDLHFQLVGARLEVGMEFDLTQKFREAIVASFAGMKDVVLSIMKNQASAGEDLSQDVKLWAARHDEMKAGRLEVRCTIAMKREARAGA